MYMYIYRNTTDHTMDHTNTNGNNDNNCVFAVCQARQGEA